MKKSEKKLMHGLRISRTLVAAVFVLLYLFFFPTAGSRFLVGYVMLTLCISCNSHGRNVQLPMEQELSLIMKCIMANLIMSVFLTQIFDILQTAKKMLLLTASQTALVLVLSVVREGLRSTRQPRRLYIFGQNRINILPENSCGISVDFPDINKKIEEFDEVYLYDISAKNRNDLMKLCFEHRLPVYFTTKLSDMELRAAGMAKDGESPIFYRKHYGISRKSAFFKRLFDIVCSLVLLVILSPLMLVIAAAVKLNDGGKVFYRQTRCTKDMKEFDIIKFRSMVENAEKEDKAVLAWENDPRITRVGRILRKFRIDEIPQLINILVGDMSFVGPRPERPEFIRDTVKTVPEFKFRVSVKAGLTGYAQVHGSYKTEFLDKLKWDLMYIENYSLMLDIKIMLMTIPAVIMEKKR